MLDHELSGVIHADKQRAMRAALRDHAALAGRRVARRPLMERISAAILGRRPRSGPGPGPRGRQPAGRAATPPAA
ncbi:MAG: hypothetical protein U0869_02210 [Chloroflexota bacterium]